MHKHYFKHDCGARHDKKIIKVILKYKEKGYALYFMLLEFMAENQEARIKIEDIPVLALDLHQDVTFMREFIDFISSDECGLLFKKGNSYTSSRLKRHLNEVRTTSETNRRNALKRWRPEKESDATEDATALQKESEHKSDGNSRREEKRREEKNIEEKIPKESIESKRAKVDEKIAAFRKEVLEYVSDWNNRSPGKYYPEVMVESFLAYYTQKTNNGTSTTWLDAKRKKGWELSKRFVTWRGNSWEYKRANSNNGNSGGNKRSDITEKNEQVLRDM